MGRKPGLADDPVRDLENRLRSVTGSVKFGAHWSRRETSRRVRVREHLEDWWPVHGFDKVPAVVGKRIACALIGRAKLASKIAGIALLESPLEPRTPDLVAFGELLVSGAFGDDATHDANLVDWFAAKVIAPLVDRAGGPTTPGRLAVARVLVDWAGSPSATQRRCACRALVPHAGDRTYAPLVLLVCGMTVWSHEPADQLQVGALLKALASVEPRRVEAFVRRIAHLMSKPAIRSAPEPFAVALRTELLAHWKRATRVRR